MTCTLRKWLGLVRDKVLSSSVSPKSGSPWKSSSLRASCESRVAEKHEEFKKAEDSYGKTLIYPTKLHKVCLAYSTRCWILVLPQQLGKCPSSLLSGRPYTVLKQPHPSWLPPYSLPCIGQSDAKRIGNPPMKAILYFLASYIPQEVKYMLSGNFSFLKRLKEKFQTF